MSLASHPRYILDASVAAKWFTRHDEPHRQKAMALRSMHLSGRSRLVIPEFALLEVLNAVRYSARAVEEDALSALEWLESLRLEIIPLDWSLLRKSATLAWSRNIALYDAAYVALAEREGAPLVTADDTMSKKMAGHGLVLRLKDLEFA